MSHQGPSVSRSSRSNGTLAVTLRFSSVFNELCRTETKYACEKRSANANQTDIFYRQIKLIDSPSIDANVKTKVKICLKILLGPCKRMNHALIESFSVFRNHLCKIPAGVTVMQEHGEARHLGEFKLTFKVLDLRCFRAKKESIVIYWTPRKKRRRRVVDFGFGSDPKVSITIF